MEIIPSIVISILITEMMMTVDAAPKIVCQLYTLGVQLACEA